MSTMSLQGRIHGVLRAGLSDRFPTSRAVLPLTLTLSPFMGRGDQKSSAFSRTSRVALPLTLALSPFMGRGNQSGLRERDLGSGRKAPIATIGDRDVDDEPTGMYSRRVASGAFRPFPTSRVVSPLTLTLSPFTGRGDQKSSAFSKTSRVVLPLTLALS